VLRRLFLDSAGITLSVIIVLESSAIAPFTAPQSHRPLVAHFDAFVDDFDPNIQASLFVPPLEVYIFQNGEEGGATPILSALSPGDDGEEDEIQQLITILSQVQPTPNEVRC
jgi:hypothetical protein